MFVFTKTKFWGHCPRMPSVATAWLWNSADILMYFMTSYQILVMWLLLLVPKSQKSGEEHCVWTEGP